MTDIARLDTAALPIGEGGIRCGALLLLVACAKPAQPLPPVLGNQRVDVPDEQLPPNCESPARVTLRIGGR